MPTGGTADEAKAMLMKAVAAVKADKAKALDMFNKGEGGFLDRDLYVFCGNVSDGKNVALGNPNAKQLIGVDARTLKDATGKPFGAELYAAYQKPEGEITEVNYVFPRPGADKTPVAKVSLVTRSTIWAAASDIASKAGRAYDHIGRRRRCCSPRSAGPMVDSRGVFKTPAGPISAMRAC